MRKLHTTAQSAHSSLLLLRACHMLVSQSVVHDTELEVFLGLLGMRSVL